MRMSAESRKQHILAASAELCKKIGYRQLTKKMIAERAKISKSLINYHFKSMPLLRLSLLNYARDKKIDRVIVQALIAKEPCVMDLPDAYKKRVAKCLWL